MSFRSELSKRLKQAVHAQDWKTLDQFLADESLLRLHATEKELLAQLLFEQGTQIMEKRGEHGFYQASDLFTKGAFLTRPSKEILWKWGVCLYEIAKESEEASDLKLALNKFQEAQNEGLTHPHFLLDYGTALGEMGTLLSNPEMLMDAIYFLETSISKMGDNFVLWLRLACASKILYLMTADVSYFEKADQSFVAAARLLPSQEENEQELWINWAQLLIFEGKLTEDSDLLTTGLEKLYRVDQDHSHDWLILTTIADALTHLGIFEERYDYFKEAESALELALHKAPRNCDILCHLGHCLTNMGKYLSDPKPINKAIETLQRGVSQEKNNYYLWHSLAMAYFTLAELNQNQALYQKASRFFGEVVKLGGDLPCYWNDWGVALMKIGEMTNEISIILEAVEKFEGAIQCFNRKGVGKADPDWFYNYGSALDWLGGCSANPHYFERAISILSRLLEQFPDFYHIRYNLALSLYHLGDLIGEVELLEKAIGQFESYLKEEPEDEVAFSDLGVTYLTLGEILQEEINNQLSIESFAKADAYLSHAIALGHGRSNYYLACSHALKGDEETAIHFLERAKKQGALPTLDFLLEDDWMAPLLETESFKAFINRLG